MITTFGLISLGIGILLSMVASLQLIVRAFEESFLWGICYLFIPFAQLVFLIAHWDRAKEPFVTGLFSIPFLVVGIIFTAPVLS